MEMFKECLSDDSFFGRSARNCPQVIITDNCSELREALKHTLPNTVLLLCIFHLMQQVWRWLFDRKHNISAAERPDILLLFKAIVYEKEEVMIEQTFDTLISSDMVKKCQSTNLRFSRCELKSFLREECPPSTVYKFRP